MAHKAKPKKKPQDALAMGNPNPTSASKSKPKSAAKPNSKRAESTKTGSPKTQSVSTKPASAKDGALASSSATNAVAKAPNSSAKRTKAPPTPTSATQGTEEKPAIAILPRRQKKSNKNTDKLGPSALTLWKKSSGRSKTWTNSKRTKLTPGDLELLVQSKTTPVAFGWNFSMLTAPANFLRSQGIRSNEKPEAKKKRTSDMRAKACDDLDSEYESNWPLPRGYPSRRPTRVPEPVSKRMEGYHLRLTISHGGVLVNQEEFLKTVTLSAPPKVSAGSTDNPEKVRPDQVEALIVVKLLYNESHADVYLVRKANNSMAYYHAHQFVSGVGFSGNWATFSKRKMNRLRRSKGFYGECIQDGRKVLVMEVEKKDPIVAETGFNIKNMVKVFPPLPGVDTKASKPRPKKFRVSYAAIVGRKKPAVKPSNSNHPAYKAWENRHGKGKGTTLTAAEKRAKKTASEKALAEFAAWVNRGKEQNCPLRNRFQILCSPVMPVM